MSGFASFARGLAGGVMLGKDRAAERRGTDFVPQDASAPAAPAAAPGGEAAGGDWTLGDPVAEGLSPVQKAFLNSVAVGESGGAWDVRYSPKGAVKFSGDQHPRIFEEGPDGPSSAAGRYQFTATTWDDTGGGAFTRAAQDKRAWDLASKRYSAWSGRDLGADLEARGLGADVLSALTPTWTSFKNQNRAIKAYNDSLARYSAGGGAAPAVVSAAPAGPEEPKTLVGTLAGNFQRNVATARENLSNIGTPSENWRELRTILGG